ncbi:hypothetical protein [Pedobacter cryophilus]|uniref:Uncharacterized protein n=1 Tax=Pedobacter cryophilus TaxID=2571271 RepID=A0A4U1BXS5_9SPHI|nr:hypothetical protein [Pedobacter cryophilus]TKB97786.1 hypothetical protein FA046_10525 [Pedobacter cryophilus]
MLSSIKQIICATLLTGVYDVNRNELLAEDHFEIIKDWYNSIVKLQLRGIVFHNTFSDETINTYQNKNVSFIKVNYDGTLNANVYRYFIYKDFLEAYADKIDHLFVTDIADVEVIKNPFIEPLFVNHPEDLFCGDEPEILANEWMQNHNTHLRNSISGFSAYEEENNAQTLLNCGIIGGSVKVMKTLMDELVNIHSTYTIHNKSPYTLDMGAFNYVARTQFSQHLQHGEPINTIFKQYQTTRSDCWFKHK